MSEIKEQSGYESPKIIPKKLMGVGEIETQAGLERLAEERIVDAKLLAENLKSSGKSKLKTLIKLYGNILGSKSVDISVINAKVELENEIIRDLFKKLKSKIKMAVTIGMATVAFSGAGDFEKAKGGESVTIETEIASIENLKQKATTEEEREAIENYEQLVKNAQESLQKINNSTRKEPDLKLRAEKIKEDLKKHIGSKEYFNKLVIEFEGNIDWAKNVQRDRLNFLNNVETNFSDKQSMQGKYLLIGRIPDNVDVPIPEWLLKIIDADSVGGFYLPFQHKIFLQNQHADDYTVQHEYLHASTNSIMGISEKAEEILRNSYKSIGEKGTDDYLSSITERLARKQALDAEMEKLGIKKYDEDFTGEHYDKLLEYNKAGNLSAGAREFIKTTKPEFFKKIFNEIATNKNINSDLTKHV